MEFKIPMFDNKIYISFAEKDNNDKQLDNQNLQYLIHDFHEKIKKQDISILDYDFLNLPIELNDYVRISFNGNQLNSASIAFYVPEQPTNMNQIEIQNYLDLYGHEHYKNKKNNNKSYNNLLSFKELGQILSNPNQHLMRMDYRYHNNHLNPYHEQATIGWYLNWNNEYVGQPFIEHTFIIGKNSWNNTQEKILALIEHSDIVPNDFQLHITENNFNMTDKFNYLYFQLTFLLPSYQLLPNNIENTLSIELKEKIWDLKTKLDSLFEETPKLTIKP